jgi:hypothetical protein
VSDWLLIGGDSFSRVAWKKYGWDSDDDTLTKRVWGKLLGDKLNMKVKFVSSVTSCNSRIASLVCSELLKHPTKYSLVCILWSNFFPYQLYNVPYVRWDFGFLRTSPNFYNQKEFMVGQLENTIDEANLMNSVLQVDESHNVENAIILENVENNIKKTEIVCNYYGAKLISMQGSNPINSSVMNKVLPHYGHLEPIYNVLGNWSDYMSLDKLRDGFIDRLDLFDDNNFIGWPLLPELGGTNFESTSTEIKNSYLCISKTDSHPSAQGHEYIFNNFLSRI